MVPLPPLRDGGCALPICPFGRACLPLISDAPDCTCSPGRLRFWVVWASCPGAAAPISILAPRGGATAPLATTTACSTISIHAPRVGRDSKFDDFTPSNLHKRYKRVLARPKNARGKRKNKAKACLHSRIFGLFGVRRFRNLLLACTSHPIPLDHQRAFGIIARFGAEMLDAGVILIPKVVKAQTVHGFIHDRA